MKKFLLNSKSFVIAFVIANLFFITTAAGQTNTWTGATDNDWNVATNWSLGLVPIAAHDVVIPATLVPNIQSANATCNTLNISGTLTMLGNTDRSLTVSGNVTVNIGGTLTGTGNGGHTLLIGGNVTNNGTFTDNATAIDRVTFNGAANQTVSGAGTTMNFNLITVNNTGAANNNIVEVSSTNFAVPTNFLTLTAGIFKVSGSFTLSNTFFTPASYTIAAGAGLWLNNANATVIAQNGAVTLNGSLRVSAGTYNVGTTNNSLIWGNNSVFTMDGGAVNVAARFAPATATSTSVITFNMSGGTLTTSMGSSNPPNASGTIASFDIPATGLTSSFTMSGGTIVMQKASSGVDYRMSTPGTVAITGGTVQFGNASTTGSPAFDIGAAAGALNSLPALTVNATGTPSVIINTDASIKGDITVGTGTSLSTVTQLTTINGTVLQTISGAGTSTFSGLTINNTAGVALNKNATVNAALTLTNGLLSVATTDTLIIPNGNVIGGTGFSATKHIATLVNTITGARGFVRVSNIASNSVYLFPVGDGTNYLPATLTLSAATAMANNSFSVCAFNGITADGTPNGTPFSAAQKAKVVDAVWTINYNGPGTPTQSPGNTSLLLGWPSTLEGASFSTNPNPLIGIAHFDGPLWGTAVGSGDNVANTATRTNVTTFSPFAVGTINAGGAPLAIKVNYFNAAKGNGVNTLNWAAACSSTEATFEIERSSDGVSFTTINSITATQARCAQPFSYDDNSNVSALAYYRIKAIDYNGKISYTLIIKVGSQVKDMRLAGLLPNPVSNTAQLSITTAKKDKVELSIVSLEGKVVYRNTVQLQNGTSIVNLEISNLSKGTYVVRGVFSDGQTNSIKFVKQ